MEQFKRVVGDEGAEKQFARCSEGMWLRKSYDEEPLGLQADLEHIEAWVHGHDSKPLLVSGEVSCGKKTLLCAFLRKNAKATDLVQLAEFGSITPQYCTILYRIMMNLRHHFDITQQVELNEERLRRYFKYWLEIASDLISRQDIGRPQPRKLLIVIEGIDLLTDSNGVPVEPEFWLPMSFPSNVRLLLTTSRSFPSIADRMNSLQLAVTQGRLTRILSQANTPRFELFKQQLGGVAKLLSKFTLLQVKTLQKLSMIQPEWSPSGDDFAEVLNHYIDYVAPGLPAAEPAENRSRLSKLDGMPREHPNEANSGRPSPDWLTADQVKSLLLVLALSQKGLKARMVCEVVGVPLSHFVRFRTLFAPLLIEDQDYFAVCRKPDRQAIEKISGGREKRQSYHEIIARTLKREPLSSRRLEEQIHNLRGCDNNGELKELLCQVEHFLLLYTPLSKHLLCTCWAKLEHHSQYDPVFEYNRALETLVGHIYPSEQDLFRIIFQLSLFFKEYSRFENSKTPAFRHPPLHGDPELLRSLGLFDELQAMAMLATNQAGKKETLRGEQSAIASELNVAISSKQTLFRENYLRLMGEYFRQYSGRREQGEEGQLEDEDSDIEEEGEFDSVFRRMLVKDYAEYLEEEHHKAGDEQCHYYYKQWVWLQFPWLAQSVRHNFSEAVRSCLSLPTKFMAVQTELDLLTQVVKLVHTNQKTAVAMPHIQVLPFQPHLSLNSSGLCGSTLRTKKSRGDFERESVVAGAGSQLHRSQYELSLGQNAKTAPSDLDPLSLAVSLVPKGASRSAKPARVKVFTAAEIQKLTQDELAFQEHAIRRFAERIRPRKRLSESNGRPINENKTVFLTDDVKLPALKGLRSNEESAHLSQISLLSKRVSAFVRRDEQEQANFIKQQDRLKAENHAISLKVAEMRRLNKALEEQKLKEDASKMLGRIGELEKKDQGLERSLKGQEELKERLEAIIKVSEANETHGFESEELAQFQSALKTMELAELAKCREIRAKATEFLEERRAAIKQLKHEKRELIRSMKKCERLVKERTPMVSEANTVMIRETSRGDDREEGQHKGLNQSASPNGVCKPKHKKKASTEASRIFEGLELSNMERGQAEARVEHLACCLIKHRELQLRTKELRAEVENKRFRIVELRLREETLRHGKVNRQDIELRKAYVAAVEARQATVRRNALVMGALLNLKDQQLPRQPVSTIL